MLECIEKKRGREEITPLGKIWDYKKNRESGVYLLSFDASRLKIFYSGTKLNIKQTQKWKFAGGTCCCYREKASNLRNFCCSFRLEKKAILNILHNRYVQQIRERKWKNNNLWNEYNFYAFPHICLRTNKKGTMSVLSEMPSLWYVHTYTHVRMFFPSNHWTDLNQFCRNGSFHPWSFSFPFHLFSFPYFDPSQNNPSLIGYKYHCFHRFRFRFSIPAFAILIFLPTKWSKWHKSRRWFRKYFLRRLLPGCSPYYLIISFYT